MAKQTFTLQPITPLDFCAIAKISADSFANDRHTLMKAHHANKNPYNHEEASFEPLTHYLAHPEKFQLLKAVDDTTGEILGSVIWGFSGYARENVPTLNGRGIASSRENEAPERASVDDAPVEGAGALQEEDAFSRAQEPSPQSRPPQREDKADDEAEDSIACLQALTSASMSHWQSILMPPGTKCMFIVGLTVSPAYHGKGVGSALLRWGTSHADADNVFCWVSSSASAWTFYAREGFEVIGDLDVDLDDYTPQPPDEVQGGEIGSDRERKWGRYIWRYMKRLPR